MIELLQDALIHLVFGGRKAQCFCKTQFLPTRIGNALDVVSCQEYCCNSHGGNSFRFGTDSIMWPLKYQHCPGYSASHIMPRLILPERPVPLCPIGMLAFSRSR